MLLLKVAFEISKKKRKYIQGISNEQDYHVSDWWYKLSSNKEKTYLGSHPRLPQTFPVEVKVRKFKAEKQVEW